MKGKHMMAGMPPKNMPKMEKSMAKMPKVHASMGMMPNKAKGQKSKK